MAEKRDKIENEDELMKNINKQIKENNLSHIYLLYGEEDYLKKSYKNKLKNAIVSPEDTMNFNYFYGTGINFNEVIDIAETMPFFAERRLILIEDSEAFKSSKEELIQYMETLPEATYFIFVESEVDKRSRMYKKIKELGYPCEFKRQSKEDLSKWALGIISAEHKKITYDTMELFLTKTGDDMENISRELEKLLSYICNKDVITAEDVEQICATEITGKIFEMIDAMGLKNKDRLFSLYRDLLFIKEPPMRILYLLERQLNIMLQVKELNENGYSAKTISEKIKLNIYAVNKTLKQIKNFNKDVLINALSDMADMEEMIKTGSLTDKIAVEIFLVKYSE